MKFYDWKHDMAADTITVREINDPSAVVYGGMIVCSYSETAAKVYVRAYLDAADALRRENARGKTMREQCSW